MMFVSAMAPLALMFGLVFLAVLPGLIMVRKEEPMRDEEPEERPLGIDLSGYLGAYVNVAADDGYWPDTYERLSWQDGQDLIRAIPPH